MPDSEMQALAAKAEIENSKRVDGKQLLNPIGETYGRLVVQFEVARTSPRKRRFLCKCDCGKLVEQDLNKLRTGHVRSCGCLHVEARLKNIANAPRLGRLIHGLNKTPEHRAWVHMKQRCSNPNKKEYKHYGGRGIKVCDAWINSFESFLACVGTRPSSKHSLDRIDVNGNYEPGNVRWATQQQQIDNTRAVRMVTIDGVTKSISSWERHMGLSKGQVKGRESRGWAIYDAILTPSIPGQKKYKAAEIGRSMK